MVNQRPSDTAYFSAYRYHFRAAMNGLSPALVTMFWRNRDVMRATCPHKMRTVENSVYGVRNGLRIQETQTMKREKVKETLSVIAFVLLLILMAWKH